MPDRSCAWDAGRFTGGAVGAFALSMLVYPFAFGYAVVLLVLDAYPLRRFSAGPQFWRDANTRRILLEKVPFALLGSLILFTLLGRLSPTDVWTTPQAMPSLSAASRVMQSCYIWTYYLWKPWAPVRLAPVYTSLISFNLYAAPFLASAGLVVALTAFLVWQRRRWPCALALWICHLTLLAPAIGLTEHPHYPSDRYSYVQGVLWSVLLAAGLLHLRPRPTLFVTCATVLATLVALTGFLSLRQMRIWHDSVRLFECTLSALGDHPYRADLHWRLGLADAR